MPDPPVAENPVLAPAPARPVVRVTPREWVQANLFNSGFNAALTVVVGAAILWVAWRVARFVLVTAEWEIVRRNLLLFMIGRFPRDELWRPWASLYLVAATLGLGTGLAARAAHAGALEAGAPPPPRSLRAGARRFWPVLLLAVVIALLVRTPGPVVLLAGAAATAVLAVAVGRRLPAVVARRGWVLLLAGVVASLGVLQWFGGIEWDRWGGLQLTLFVTVAGIVLAFPLGLLLALGRRSSLPAVRATCVTYIEVIRGVPLITLLLMGQFFIGFFVPTWASVPGLVSRALIAIVLFEAAYVAEIVRGGLQAVPRGQIEAAQAVGLRPWKSMRLVVLPQALRAVIPAMVGQFISLFKDTSLLTVIGLLELLSVAQAVNSQPDFVGRGLSSVTLPFAAFVYWVGSYTMSRESQRLERRLGIGER